MCQPKHIGEGGRKTATCRSPKISGNFFFFFSSWGRIFHSHKFKALFTFGTPDLSFLMPYKLLLITFNNFLFRFPIGKNNSDHSIVMAQNNGTRLACSGLYMFNLLFSITWYPRTTGLFGFADRLWLFCKHCKIRSQLIFAFFLGFFSLLNLNNSLSWYIYSLPILLSSIYFFLLFHHCVRFFFPYHHLSCASLSLTSGCQHTNSYFSSLRSIPTSSSKSVHQSKQMK